MTIHAQLMTRPGCPLCDEMKQALERVSASTGLDVLLVEVDVSTSPELEARYGVDVPVLFLDGDRAFEHRASDDELRRRLEALARRPQ